MLVNNVMFAKEQHAYSGKIDLLNCIRIQEIDSYKGIIEFDIKGCSGIHNRPTLELKVYGIIHSLCQNCLQPKDVTIDNKVVITIFYSEEELDKILFTNEIEDGILADKEFDLIQLVEDELIMLLPYTIKHDSCVGLNYIDKTNNAFENLKKLL